MDKNLNQLMFLPYTQSFKDIQHLELNSLSRRVKALEGPP